MDGGAGGGDVVSFGGAEGAQAIDKIKPTINNSVEIHIIHFLTVFSFGVLFLR